jgi:hypothetical protein
MEVKGIDLSILIVLGLLILLLNLYGPFVLLLFLTVPFYLLYFIYIRKFLNPNHKFVPLIITTESFIRGPPQN